MAGFYNTDPLKGDLQAGKHWSVSGTKWSYGHHRGAYGVRHAGTAEH